ncbi:MULTISPECIES: PTS sugar transporter subunit IIA [Paenibacillus]|uniref:PTS glucose transporter subunit IIA n=1 Tax=Paenibacillus campinasensis TaxID=66347 RepID=A0A268EPS8_9BACL|nr:MULTISPECIES: PTS glucose transporter subunit IIA [Paenibacillus]MUG66628.1 PTS glucose transporter subunit IIA [Paenibacillus campinasensis]PAD75127.1 PTS glucose transporter subunit IIA [Paenibacillus campinasensis]PAK50474.1 PTS glucose transporter subunit IIA [Paenibacillus sp. 7541]
MFGKWKKKKAASPIEIKAPLTGKAVPLSEVPDEAFAAGHMGQGIAIEPAEGRLVAPFDGTVAHVIKSKHAVMLEDAQTGLQYLFHIGINTVGLKGEGYTSHVNTGDQVKAGQVLIEFDMEAIRNAGYPLITPIIVTNADELASKVEGQTGHVAAGQDVVLNVELKA